MALSLEQVRELYNKRAKYYDISANLYYLIGFREDAYRKKAIGALGLRPGDTVVDMCCGTGLNFRHIQERIGSEGRVIGIDLTEKMLDQAAARVERNGWKNVELVHSDAAKYAFPEGVNGIISSFAITLVPQYDEVIRAGSEVLAPGGRWSVLDFRMPEGWHARLAPVLIRLTSPFGVTADLETRHPWESMERYMDDVTVSGHYLGFVYIASGVKR